jgi:phosphoenolpyruvate carboxylase
VISELESRELFETEERIRAAAKERRMGEALPSLYEDLEDAVAVHYPGLRLPVSWLRLASWMGGDRDA